jgi:hypothetical protein
MAAVIAEYMSERVEETTRAVKVELFSPWSACRIMQTSKARAMVGVGIVPLSM